MTTYTDPFHEYPPHSHEINPNHAETCQVCGALILANGDDENAFLRRLRRAVRRFT